MSHDDGSRVWLPATFEHEPTCNILDLHLAQGIPYGRVARTIEVAGATVLAHFNPAGEVLGLEILDPWPPGASVAAALPEGDQT
jgi:hypothetical protein